MVREGLCEVEVGNVCMCNAEKMGVVSHTQNVKAEDGSFYILYKGVGFDGKPWQSKCPKVVSKTLSEHLTSIMMIEAYKETEY